MERAEIIREHDEWLDKKIKIKNPYSPITKKLSKFFEKKRKKTEKKKRVRIKID